MRSPEQSRRREVRVTFESGKTLETAINGTEEEIVRYYKDNSFNLGVAGNDDRSLHAKPRLSSRLHLLPQSGRGGVHRRVAGRLGDAV